jgi:hypothetical protein
LATPPTRDRKKTLRRKPAPGKQPIAKARRSKPQTLSKKPAKLVIAPTPSDASKGPAPQELSAPSKTRIADSTTQEVRATEPSTIYENGHRTIFTIGHSTHPIDEFIGLLKHYGIEQLVDVRTVPKSRHVPQFNSEALADALGKQGIEYVHLKSLGGLRHAKKDSVNRGWHNASFRGYADYMSNEEFTQGIDRLIELAKTKRTVIMCAEAVPWRCHRSLIGDALLVRDIAVEDIMGVTSIRPHKLTEFANVVGRQITYPAEKTLDLFQS